MATLTVKLPKTAHAKLADFSAEDRRPMSEILGDLIERERRRRFFEKADAAYLRLQADPAAWADYQAELRSLDGRLMDGLKDDPWEE